ncbi:hypothetical protein QMK19_37250 [Streptomyces sp. H10-C2]|nr:MULTISPECIES: hypothetical protein [unclassified Streptomyces]MDJ0347308.1 hypothetical protein [Streptomyces sp. PH10-H1]MDJ0375105.1 hypothetical protein [Streptomyces sp. H10-C2]
MIRSTRRRIAMTGAAFVLATDTAVGTSGSAQASATSGDVCGPTTSA